ncbi:MAG: Uma2 family endonuclease [Roseiflexaceae bacterium]
MAINKTPTRAVNIPSVTAEAFHYYDTHPTSEDLVGESAAQSQLIFYLLKVLGWLYRAEGWFVIGNLNIYREPRRNEYPIAPDVAVFKGVVVPSAVDRQLRSWRLYEPNRPAPQVVFEISSQETWRSDLEYKPAAYAALGVQEYYAFDPNDPPYWPKGDRRLRGWWLESGIMIEQQADSRGRIWSVELGSWLVADSALLRMYDQDGRMRLTQGEAQRAVKETERVAKQPVLAKLRELSSDPTSRA